MTWVRDGESPKIIKVSFVVSAKDHPELARFIWSLPYRGASRALRDILSSAVKTAAAGRPATTASIPVEPAAQTAYETALTKPLAQAVVAQQQPGTGDVSAAAAGIIENFDRMFPS